MKTILLIIRHFLPRRRWVDVETLPVYTEGHGRPTAYITTQRGQFGNLRTFKIKP
jgi:hypothetical protein